MSVWSRWWKRIGGLGRRRSFALNELDRQIEPFLDFDRGTFIEAGANDGLQQSNTLYFERYRQWTGLLVEPIPDLATRCRRNRPRCRVENVALAPHGHPQTHLAMRFCGLMSVVKGGMKSFREELEHVQAGSACQRLQPYDVTVPVATLSDLWDRHQLEEVDLLSLDVEGYELQALQGLDFDRHRPGWMLIEARYREDIDAYVLPWYEAIAELSHHDVLYKRRAA
jgi:FkbM family methyltransferase